MKTMFVVLRATFTTDVVSFEVDAKHDLPPWWKIIAFTPSKEAANAVLSLYKGGVNHAHRQVP